MLLFQKRFHAGLLDGSISLTFRQWERPRVKVGGRYRVHPIGVVEVDRIDRVEWREVKEHDARRAGFASLAELRDYVRRGGEIPPPELALYRIELHHGGDGDRVSIALNDRLAPEEVAELEKRLTRLDRAGKRPWTARTLELIRKHPQRRAGDLADLMKRPKEEFKADVVKLKRLGLTQSFEVGYELSPRGRAFLRRSGWLRKKANKAIRPLRKTTRR